MATSNVNAVKYGAIGGQGFVNLQLPCNNTTAAVKQGSLVYWDSSAKIVKELDNDTHAATLCGVALDPSIVSSNVDNTGAPLPPTLGVGYGVIAGFKTTAADAYANGVLVYAGADAQTVTVSAGSNAVGVVLMPPSLSAVTGGTGVSVQIFVFGRAFGKLAN